MDLVSQSLEKLQPLPAGLENSSEETDRLKTLIEYSDRGNREAQFSVGHHYLTEGKLPQAVKYLKRAEQGDNGQARYQLAVLYYDGTGVEADPSLGFKLMLQVAQSTSSKDSHLVVSAQFNVGRAYYQGYGIAQSDDEAIHWWTLAANNGSEAPSVRAMNTLAMVYSRPDSSDMNKAFYWHSQAALNGHLESMAAMGLLYLKGEGCKKDRETALYWMKRSSEGGSIYGTGILSHYYYCNKFFTRAVETAHKISTLETSVETLAEQSGALQILVAKGIAIACFILARCLQLGQAVSKNAELAQTYFQRATKFDKATVADLHTQMMYGKM